MSTPPRPRVALAPGKEGPIAAGHPWIFSGALARKSRSILQALPPGAFVDVTDARGDLLGTGLTSPQSRICVRLVGAAGALPDNLPLDEGAFFSKLLEGAISRRVATGSVGDAYRVVNSEGDGLPGLIVDRLGGTLVVQCTTLPMHLRRELLLELLCDRLAPTHVLQNDPSGVQSWEGFAPVRGWRGVAPTEPLVFEEGGVRYALSADAMQKTGHYLDVREHRAWVAARSSKQRVFDGFCFTGGFGLHAAVAGATEVLGVDSSSGAIDQARRNLKALGALDGEVVFSEDDVRNQLRSCYDRGRTFDVVVLDPPKFAPKFKDRKRALKSYTSLLVEGLRVLQTGGLVGISSCSHHIDRSDLVRALALAAARVGRRMTVVHTAGQPADHPWPAAMPEGRYLSFVFATDY